MESVDGRLLGPVCVTADACSAVHEFDFEHEIISKSFWTHEDRKSECESVRKSTSSPPCLAANILTCRYCPLIGFFCG